MLGRRGGRRQVTGEREGREKVEEWVLQRCHVVWQASDTGYVYDDEWKRRSLCRKREDDDDNAQERRRTKGMMRWLTAIGVVQRRGERFINSVRAPYGILFALSRPARSVMRGGEDLSRKNGGKRVRDFLARCLFAN